MRASVTRAGQAMSGLLLFGALLPGCPSGDKGLCGGEVTYGVTLVAGDDYTASVKDDLDDQLTLVIEQTDEAPDEPFNCMSNRGDGDGNVTADRVGTSWASFDLEQEFEVPAGWLCAWAAGGIAVDGESGDTIACSGGQDLDRVRACRSVDTELVVTCWARTASTDDDDDDDDDGGADLSPESGGAP